MKNLYLASLFSFISFAIYAQECPFEVKGAQLMLTIENEMYLKISSSLMCNQKLTLPDKLFDSEIEVWKGQSLVVRAYSRQATYSTADGKLFLEDATIIDGEKLRLPKFKNLNRLYMNLKRQKIYTNVGEITI